MTDTATEQNNNNRKAPPRVWGWGLFVFITLSIAITAAVGAWYVWRDAEADRARLLATLDEMTEQLAELEKLKETQAAITLHQDEAASALATMANRMERNEQQQSRLANLIEGGRRHWQVVEVEQLMLIANDRLQLHHDLPGALHALNIANQRLGDISEPKLLPTRQLLIREISLLKAVPMTDIQALTLQITALIMRSSDLPLATDIPRNFDALASNADISAESQTGWRRVFENLLAAARGMLQVRQAERPLVPLLPPDQAFFLRQNLILKLETARLALLQRDTTAFNSALDAALGWLKAFYHVSDAGVQATMTEVKELSSQNLSWEQPDISGSLAALRKYMLISGHQLSASEMNEQ